MLFLNIVTYMLKIDLVDNSVKLFNCYVIQPTMKVVCVQNYLDNKFFNSITVGKVYTAKNVEDLKEQFAYQSESSYIFNIPGKDVYHIQDDTCGNYCFYDIKLFKPLYDIRIEKLNSLI